MFSLRTKATRLLQSQSGQGIAEYIIIFILVGIIVLVAIRFFGAPSSTEFNQTPDASTSPSSEHQPNG